MPMHADERARKEKELELININIQIEQARTDNPSGLDKARNVVAGGLTDAFTGIIDTPYSLRKLADAGLSKLGIETPQTGPFGPPPQLSKAPGLKQILEMTGAQTVPEDSPWNAARTAVDWGAGALVPGSKTQKIGDVLMGAGAGLGSYLGDTFGELTGGAAGFLASLAAGKRARAPRGGSKAENRVKGFLDERMEAPLDAEELARKIHEGEVGTTAELVGDRGLYDVQAGAAVDPAVRLQLDDLSVDRQAQIAGDVNETFGAAQAAQAQAAAAARVKERIGLAQAAGRQNAEVLDETATAGTAQLEASRVESVATADAAAQAEGLAQTRAQEAAAQFEGAPRPAQASAEVAEAYDKGQKAFEKATEKPAWEAFKAQTKIDMKPLYAAVNDVIKGLDPGIKKALGSKYGALIGRLNQFKKAGTATPADLSDILSRMRASLDGVEKWGPDEINLNKVLGALDEGLESANALYRTAKDATRTKYKRFRPEKLDKTRRRAAPERLTGRLGLADEAGAETARLLDQANLPSVDQAVGVQMEAYAKRYGVDDTFLAKYSEILDRLPPEQRVRFTELADANRAAKEASKEAARVGQEQTQAQKALDREQLSLERELDTGKADVDKRVAKLEKATAGTPIGRYAANPAAELKRLLSSPDNIPELKRLYEALDARGAGDSLRAAVRDRFEKMAMEAGDTTPGVTPRSRKVFRDMQAQLVESGILTENKAKTITQTLERTRSQTLTKAASRQVMERFEGELNNVASSMAAAGVLNLLPGGSTSLMVGGALKRLFRKAVNKTGQSADLRVLNEVLTDPQAMLELMKGVKTPAEAAQRIVTKVMGATQSIEAMAGG